MLCDDCAKQTADYHMGHGIVVCYECVKRFDMVAVQEKMRYRSRVLKDLAEGKYVPYDELKTLPLEMWMESISE